MEKEIVVSMRFRENTLDLFEYLLKEFSEKSAFNFIEQLEQRIELIRRYPEIGQPFQLRPNVRSVILKPHIRIFYRLTLKKVELLYLFDMRKNDAPD